jgi:hypothetical protein
MYPGLTPRSRRDHTMEPEKPAKKRAYVQPNWVDGGYGVEVLEPGYWTDTDPGREPNSISVERP